MNDTSSDTAASLREWARGMYAIEAAVELLIRSFGGRFAQAGQPWVQPRSDGCWLDTETLATYTGGLSGGEQRVLAVVCALAGDEPLADVSGVLAGLDRINLALVLAAFSHAAGSHQHSLARGDGFPFTLYHPGPLLPWPDPTGVA